MDYFALALLTGTLVGLLSGLVGVLVLLRQRAFYTVALTHATFPGGVFAAAVGINIVVGASIFSLLLVALMAGLSRVPRQGKQVAAGIILSFGYALGMLFASLNRGQSVRVDSYLTGSILAMNPTNVWLLGGALVVVLGVYTLFGKQLLFSSFDARGFRAAGFREGAWDFVALALITLTVVVAMPAIGSILAIAMIAAPAAAARLLTKRIGWMLALSCAFGVTAAVVGLHVSRSLSFAAGGSMALTAVAIFVIALLAKGAVERFAQGVSQRASATGMVG